MSCPLIPREDRVILEVVAENQTSGGIALPDSVAEGMFKYRVYRKGPGKYVIHEGKTVVVPMEDVEVGDVFVLPAALKPSHRFGSGEYVIASINALPARYPREAE